MPKLWIYGDSFSTARESNYKVWTNLLAEQLNAELCITAKGGSSLGWMMYRSSKDKYNYSQEDFVIFQTTTPVRALLDKNKPGLAEYWKDCPDWNSLTKEQQNGYMFHLLNIHDEEILLDQFQMWIWGMHHYTQHLKCKPLLLTAWDLGSFDVPEEWCKSQGAMLDASMAEFSGSYDDSIKWMLDNAGDPRENHFSTTNHYKLSFMLYDALIHRVTPNFDNLEKKLYKSYPALGNESWSRGWIV